MPEAANAVAEPIPNKKLNTKTKKLKTCTTKTQHPHNRNSTATQQKLNIYATKTQQFK